MYNVEIHKVLKNDPKIKTIPLFERGHHLESNYIIENKKGF